MLDLAEVSRRCAPVLATQPIARAYVFGSYARGEQTDESNVDICYDLQEGEVFRTRDGHRALAFDAIEAARDLRHALGAALGLSVDLVPRPTERTLRSRASRVFLEEVERDRRLIYECAEH